MKVRLFCPVEFLRWHLTPWLEFVTFLNVSHRSWRHCWAWGCASLWHQKNSTWGGSPELASSLIDRSAYRADQRHRQRRMSAWLHNRTFAGQIRVPDGEQLLPWWLYVPRQSPTTRWKTPLWRSFSAAPSAPERRWSSRLEQRQKKDHSNRDSYPYQSNRSSCWLFL